MGHFASPNAGGIKKFEHGAVTQAEGIGGVGDGQQPRDFIGIECFGQMLGYTRFAASSKPAA